MVHLAVALTVVSVVLYATMMALFAKAVIRRRRAAVLPLRAGAWIPRVTVFKPLAGDDDDLADNLESFAGLDYPSFEILLGAATRNDPAVAMAHRFAARHPELTIRLVITDPDAAANPKVAQLIGLGRHATGDVYVMSDSNVRVKPGYLWSLVNELADPRVGVATSLFSGAGERSVGAALENLQICAATTPGLAAAEAALRNAFVIGKSMAVRRADFERLGGFGMLGSFFAEDYVLGHRFRAAGFETRTSQEIIENRNVVCTVRQMFARHTRWAKTRRSVIPQSARVEPIMMPVVVATAGLLLAPCATTAALLAAVAAGQTVCALLAVRLLRGEPLAWYYAPLEILSSYIAFACWLRACLSRRVVWRGHAFVLQRGGAIVPISVTHRPSGRRPRLAA
jgi:ceramide glucosyltransferase